MVFLSPRDAAILAKVAQYDQLPKADREAMIETLADAKAKRVGHVIIGSARKSTVGQKKTADMIKGWAARNRGFARSRRTRSVKSS